MSWRKWALLELALLAIMILASRAALVIHEVGGHALPAQVMGASRITIRLSPLGGGFVEPAFPAGRPPTPARNALFCLGGIALNLLTGTAAWIGARRLKSRGLAYVALLFFGAGSVAGAIVYLTCGFYYGSGDPVGFAPRTEDISRVQWVWILFVPAGAGVAWLAVRHYLDFLSGHALVEDLRRRIGWLVATVGVAGLVYFGLWLALRNPKIEGSTSKWRLEREIAQETARRAATPPPAPPLGVRPTPPPPPVVVPVRPEEVIHRVPPPVAPWVLYVVMAFAGFLSLRRSRPPSRIAEIRWEFCTGLALVAAGVVTAFRLLS